MKSLTEKASEGLKNVKLSHLSGLLDNEKKRAASVKALYWENAVLLQRQTHLYLTVRAYFRPEPLFWIRAIANL